MEPKERENESCQRGSPDSICSLQRGLPPSTVLWQRRSQVPCSILLLGPSIDQTQPLPENKSLSKALQRSQPPGAQSWAETGGRSRGASGEDAARSLSHFAMTSYRQFTKDSNVTQTITRGQELFLKPSQLECDL